MSITIIKSGIQATVQDLGRSGYQKYGVPVGGAMDTISAQLANLICGNDEKEGLIEFTLHDAKLFFNESAFIAICGSGAQVEINNQKLPFNRLIQVEAYSTLTWKPTATGCRSYLAVSGGLDIPHVMNSVSTYLPSSLGGLNGRELKSDDVLKFKKKHTGIPPKNNSPLKNGFSFSKWSIPVHMHSAHLPVQFIKGPEWELFSAEDQTRFSSTAFSVSTQSNRMGYQLTGALLNSENRLNLISTGVTKGNIQVTNEGQPILLMSDAQTTGGYPRIARVCPSHLSSLAQCRPGTIIQFEEISEEQSSKNLSNQNLWLEKVKSAINSHRTAL